LEQEGVGKWPKTVCEAVEIILSQMDDGARQSLRSATRRDLDGYHFGWGMAIRQAFGLWVGNTDLLEDAGAFDADDASTAIMEAVWRRVRRDT
jgi:hypothetical protein